LKSKRVFVITGRGGVYSEGPARNMDFQEPYLRAMLGFLGLTDVTFVHVEGLNISPEAAAQGISKARAHVARLAPEVRAAASTGRRAASAMPISEAPPKMKSMPMISPSTHSAPAGSNQTMMPAMNRSTTPLKNSQPQRPDNWPRCSYANSIEAMP